ncbi:helix-turn-helix transcriptional regulator [Bdellovibrio sp. NC01]|uniref:helix-turn-helix domain-containing protein n=1 Tax=Bdellovibrio sp. NC01 TaxID=2220073 RepID=UPI00143D50D3|nr:helix-turn-helix transcriptional regulator [Bdellovibrio sp. NC01]
MEHSIYLAGLKKALKAKDVNYAELASELKMTESGVKKMLNAKDISFRRVLQICEVLNILPGQLFSLSEKSAIAEITLTNAQQDALLKNRSLLAVYWRLAIEHHELSEIETLQKISKAELKKLLDRLVSLDLLSYSKGRYKSRHPEKFKWADDSRLAIQLNREWSELTLQRSLQKDSKNLHRLIAVKLSDDTYNEFKKRISNLIDETIQESQREELTQPKNTLKTATILLATTPKGVLDP